MDYFIDILKIMLPAGLVFAAAYLIIKRFLDNDQKRREHEIKKNNQAALAPLRLQAYERIALFLERIAPDNLLLRTSIPGLPAKEFQHLLLNEIRNEYNHNVSQQIFMSEGVWDLVKGAKEDLILTINESISELDEQATSLDLSKKIMEKSMNKPSDAIAFALSELKKEIHQAF